MENVYDMGLGFGVYGSEAVPIGENTVASSPAPLTDTEVVGSMGVSTAKPTVIETITGAILGKDEQGNPKTFDLGKYIKLPEVNVKAEDSQWWVILLFLLLGLFGYSQIKKSGRSKNGY